MHCERCGAQISPGARYCAGCGEPVRAEPAPASAGWRERLAGLAGRTRRERALAAGTVFAVVVAIGAFIVLDTPEDEIPRDAFTLAADQQCLQAKEVVAKQRQAADDAPQGAASEVYAGAVLSAVTDWRLALDGLEVPADRTKEVDALEESLLELIIRLGALAKGVREGSGSEVSELTVTAEDATASVETAVDGLGLTECAAVSLGS